MGLNKSALLSINLFNELSGESIKSGDNQMEALINFASVAMESFCGRLLASRDFSYDPFDADSYDPDNSIFDGVAGDTLFFPTSPINSIEELIISGVVISPATDHEDTDGYFLYNKAGKVIYSLGFDAGYNQNVKIKWNGGYTSESAELYELQFLCYELITIARGSGTTLPIFDSEKIGNYSYKRMNPIALEKLEGMSPMVFKRLSKYKGKVFA